MSRMPNVFAWDNENDVFRNIGGMVTYFFQISCDEDKGKALL